MSRNCCACVIDVAFTKRGAGVKVDKALLMTSPITKLATVSDTDEQIILPYVQGLSEPIRRMLEEADIRVRFKLNTNLRKLLVKPKDPVPVERRTGIVYQIPCSDCSQMYVSQSGGTIVDRIKEHQQVVKNGDTNTSAVAEHGWQHQHRMDWSAAEVLDYSQHH